MNSSNNNKTNNNMELDQVVFSNEKILDDWFKKNLTTLEPLKDEDEIISIPFLNETHEEKRKIDDKKQQMRNRRRRIEDEEEKEKENEVHNVIDYDKKGLLEGYLGYSNSNGQYVLHDFNIHGSLNQIQLTIMEKVKANLLHKANTFQVMKEEEKKKKRNHIKYGLRR